MSSFEDSCFEAAKRFVQTAVIIDDEAEFTDPEEEQAARPPVSTPPDGLTYTADSDPIESEPTVSDDSNIPDFSEIDQSLNISSVVDGFADLKITCGVQRPHFGDDVQQNEKLKERVLNGAEFADITIIDWWLLKKDKHKAIDIIIDLLKKDIDVGGRVRLLCVYTAMPHPRNILDDIEKEIEDKLGLPITGKRKDFAYTVDHKVRIVVLNKTKLKVNGNNSRVVSSDKLAETVLKEFSILAKGLIPCAALHSIAAVREQTHSLLALMNKSLDGAFCAHRALIPDPDDSIDFVLNLILQEISTKILYDESARNSLDLKSLESWLNEQVLPENMYSLEKEALREYLINDEAHSFDLQQQQAIAWLKRKKRSQNQLKDNCGNNISYLEAEAFIVKGAFQKINGCSPPSKKYPDKSSELFYPKKRESEIACNEFSRLSSTSKDEGTLRKSTNTGLFLTLGSVLKVSNADTEYWLCLQPPCDSVRLKEKTEMLFVQLYEGDEGNADLVIKLLDGTYQALSIKSPGEKLKLKTHGFPPDIDSGRILIKRLNMNKKFNWVADLRSEKAQSIAQQVLNNASRIGLDEFEILRRKGSRL